MPIFPQYAVFYDVHKLITDRQTALPSVCPAFYPHTNVWLSVCPCSRIWLSVLPSLYPRVTVCLFLYPRVTFCLSGILSACHRLFVLVSACHRLFVLVSGCHRLFVLVSACRLFVLVSAYDLLSDRPCIRMLPSVCLCFLIWSSLCPSFYPRATTVNLTFLSPMKKDIWGPYVRMGLNRQRKESTQNIRVFDIKSVT
jgi:hypothetical protein